MLHRQSASLPQVGIYVDVPSVARVYDYYLGGTTNWEIDRSFGDQVLDKFPLMRRIAFAHRLFLNRVVRHLMRRGIRQFLDVGSGVPSAGATHEVADEWTLLDGGGLPDATVVYVDNDPIAVAHSELFLDNYGDRRRHAVIEADLRDPKDLWQRACATELLDPGKPVGLLLIALLHLQQLDAAGRETGPDSAIELRERLPPGSCVAISHVTDEGVPTEVGRALAGLKRIYDAQGNGSVTWRSRRDIERIMGDLSMIEPGWKPAVEWHPEDTGPNAPAIALPPAGNAVIWAGVGVTA